MTLSIESKYNHYYSHLCKHLKLKGLKPLPPIHMGCVELPTILMLRDPHEFLNNIIDLIRKL